MAANKQFTGKCYRSTTYQYEQPTTDGISSDAIGYHQVLSEIVENYRRPAESRGLHRRQ